MIMRAESIIADKGDIKNENYYWNCRWRAIRKRDGAFWEMFDGRMPFNKHAVKGRRLRSVFRLNFRADVSGEGKIPGVKKGLFPKGTVPRTPNCYFTSSPSGCLFFVIN